MHLSAQCAKAEHHLPPGQGVEELFFGGGLDAGRLRFTPTGMLKPPEAAKSPLRHPFPSRRHDTDLGERID